MRAPTSTKSSCLHRRQMATETARRTSDGNLRRGRKMVRESIRIATSFPVNQLDRVPTGRRGNTGQGTESPDATSAAARCGREAEDARSTFAVVATLHAVERGDFGRVANDADCCWRLRLTIASSLERVYSTSRWTLLTIRAGSCLAQSRPSWVASCPWLSSSSSWAPPPHARARHRLCECPVRS